MPAGARVLSGASAWEREEKANQQRDYAAQLQEQVLQKLAKQEQEKTRREQEQREELEMLRREGAAAARKRQPLQEQNATESLLPAPSPHHATSMPHMPVVELQQRASPLKAVSANPSFTGGEIASGVPSTDASLPTATFGSEGYIPAFSSVPSVLESLLREPGIGAQSIMFYNDLTTLHKLAAELDLTARQRRTTVQSRYVKPNFLCQQEVAMTSPITTSPTASLSTDRLSDNKPKDKIMSQPKMRSSLDGLLGESMLLPLTNSKLPPRISHSKTVSRVHESPIKPHQQAKVTYDDGTQALDNSSEMVHFTIAKCCE
ncbi:hypothetical protein PInf_017933 [Phytophthora infestans]|nr:hypothetical protein PInf_017933 [Phytophthora infestans]